MKKKGEKRRKIIAVVVVALIAVLACLIIVCIVMSGDFKIIGKSITGKAVSGSEIDALSLAGGYYDYASAVYDSDSYREYSDKVSLTTGKMTMEAWIYPESGASNQIIVDKGQLMKGIVFQMSLTNGKLGQIYDTDATSSRIVEYNKWSHVAITLDNIANERKYYINGELVFSDVMRSSDKIDSNFNNYPFYIGGYWPLCGSSVTMHSGPFKGKIAEVRIWDKVRTQQEIKDNINKNLVGNENGLIGYWFTVNSGLKDMTGKGSDLYIRHKYYNYDSTADPENSCVKTSTLVGTTSVVKASIPGFVVSDVGSVADNNQNNANQATQTNQQVQDYSLSSLPTQEYINPNVGEYCYNANSAFNVQENLIEQYPKSANADSGSDSVANVIGKQTDSCTNYWQKSTDTIAGKLILEFEKSVYVKTIKIISSSDEAWFTKAEAWNSETSTWTIIWMGESSNAVTEMNTRQTNFKTNKIRITSPLGKYGRICSVKLIGSEDKLCFNKCINAGKKCESGYVCTSGWKNSYDTAMCCESDCESRVYLLSLTKLWGGTKEDFYNIAENGNFNYYTMPLSIIDSSQAETLKVFGEMNNSNVWIIFPEGCDHTAGCWALTYAKERLVTYSKNYSRVKGFYADDASAYYASLLIYLNQIYSNSEDYIYFIGTYWKQITTISAQTLYNDFGAKKNVILLTFGWGIPCFYSVTEYNKIADYNPESFDKGIVAAIYTSGWPPVTCKSQYKVSGYDTDNTDTQRANWRDAIKAGATGFYWYSGWFAGTNWQETNQILVSNNSKLKAWPGAKLALDESKDLCPSCTFCAEDKVLKKDSSGNYNCCYHDETLLNGNCIAPASRQNKLCLENDWSYTITPAECPESEKQTKIWTRKNSCSNGIIHSNEEINCNYVHSQTTNLVNNFLNNIMSDTDKDRVRDSRDLCPETSAGIKVDVRGCPIPIMTGFEKYSTKLKLKDISQLKDFTLANNNGNIIFKEEVSLVRGEEPIDIDSYVEIEKNKISIDSVNIPELNRKAILIFKNINLNEPAILVDGKKCVDCTILSYTNGILSVEVSHFSVYEVVEKSVYDSISSSADGSGNNSGVVNNSDNVSVNSCTSSWDCSDWGKCNENSKQIRNCVDINSCGNISSKPSEERECEVNIDDEDSDKAIDDGAGGDKEGENEDRGINFAVIIPIIIIIILILAGGYYFYRKIIDKKDDRTSNTNNMQVNKTFEIRKPNVTNLFDKYKVK